MCNDINEQGFVPRLSRPADIDWHALTGGEDSLGAFAVYLRFTRGIAIDERFRFSPDAMRAGDAREEAKLEVAYRLVVHEMVHQDQYELKANGRGGHGASFIEIATPVADALRMPAPTADTAKKWPDVSGLIAAFKL